MCNFFSCISNGKGKIRYFDRDIRQQIRDRKLSYSEDSHDSLCSFFKGDIPMDKANKYEYDPIRGRFTVDQINATDDNGYTLDDREQVEKFCRELDYNMVVPNWPYFIDILKRIKTYKPKNPITAIKMPDEDKLRDVLKRIRASVRASVGASVRAPVWASVGAPVWASVGDSVWASVRASVRASVWASVWDSVGASVWDSVGDSVWASVGASVRASVWASVGASVRAPVWASVNEQSYICGYHAINKFMNLGIKHPAFDLIDMGVIVANVNGMIRVYGKNGKFLGEIEEAR